MCWFVSEDWIWICISGSLMLFRCCFLSLPLTFAKVHFPCTLSGQTHPWDQNHAGCGFTLSSTAA